MMTGIEACACIMLSRAQSCLMAVTYIVLCTDLLISSLLRDTALLLVQLVGALLELLLAGRLAKVVGDDRARVGLVVLEGGGTAAGGLGINVVVGVRRCVRVAGLLCDLVGDAYSSVNYAFIICRAVDCELTASGLFFLRVDRHVDGFDWFFWTLIKCCLVELG